MGNASFANPESSHSCKCSRCTATVIVGKFYKIITTLQLLSNCLAILILALVNEHMHQTFGDTIIQSSHTLLGSEVRLFMLPCIVGTLPNDIKSEIGKIISTRLVDDEATLHLGIESFMTLRIITLSCRCWVCSTQNDSYKFLHRNGRH
ncbi:uncharacterized protein LOC107981699 isoform X1 [Nasonia vitripennis]|uniref:Uncharacterized protein n=1 Tax=Nasonia vitripennis TaxID=7425 RepID=A0A7M7QBC3_NASVI|nr:uncharacterized protein LOC107981699 isoform X1 [Nasonia vitripennis]XP_031784822.1 uncharacterized protein LOC107981699 isoform X1 [Nasonia vitripennis]